MLKIIDRPGVISVAELKTEFEKAINQSPVFSKNTPLDVISLNGEFHCYSNPDTDTMWLGFVVGMRRMEGRAKKQEELLLQQLSSLIENPDEELCEAFQKGFQAQLHRRRHKWGCWKHPESAEAAGLKAMLKVAFNRERESGV